MKWKEFFMVIYIAIIFIIPFSTSVFAVMAPLIYGINNQTKECAEFFMGDECTSCELPEGWIRVGDISKYQCPEGYKEAQVNSICTPRKDKFCCTIQHSGTSGDCEDVIVNDIEKRCAFVDDINRCPSLPKNWHRAEQIEFWGRVCPSLEYEWLDEYLECEIKPATFANVETPPINPPFVELVSDEVLGKIKDYVVDYSGISEGYFNKHYEIIDAYKSVFNCQPKRVQWACAQTADCFNTYNPACNNTYAVHVYWKFNVDDYSALVGAYGGVAGVTMRPFRFAFIFENENIIGAFEDLGEPPYTVAQLSYGVPQPIPKFREVTSIILKERFNNWINGCGEFDETYPIKLARKTADEEDLSLFYYGWGKRDDKDFEFFANLETGENYCNEITLVGGKKTGVTKQPINYTNLILIIIGVILALIILIVLYKKIKK